MIPKIIHLCWLSGDPYPRKIKFCIDTWKKFCPDYEIMLWDTKRFDVYSTPWTKQAFEAKKYAFAADFIRLYAVYNYGGIYLDSDVEVLKSFDDVLDLPYFVCQEVSWEVKSLELAAFGAEKGMPWVKTAMEWYENRSFIDDSGSMNLEPQPRIMKRVLSDKYQLTLISRKEEVVRDNSKIYLFPFDWFNAHPIIVGEGAKYMVTEHTHSIHHYAAQWRDIQSGPLHTFFHKLFKINRNVVRMNKRVKLYGKK